MYRQFYKYSVATGLILLLVCVATAGHAQSRDSLLAVYNSQTIHAQGRMFVKGNRQLTFRDLRSEFQSGVTKDLYKKAKGNLVLTQFLKVTATAAIITGILIRKDNKGGALALTIGGIALNLGSFHFRKQSTSLLERALWMRNRDVLFGTR